MIRMNTVEAVVPEYMIPDVSDAVIGFVLSGVADAARDKWIQLAKQDSSSFRGDYVRGIQPPVAEGQTRYTVSLVGEVPHMLEDGTPRQDLRDTLLGPNVPVAPLGKKGKRLSKDKQFYRAIPFRHTKPGSGKTVGQGMGSAYGGHAAVDNARKLGNAVYKAAKKLTASTTDPYGKTEYWGRLRSEKLGRMRAGLKKGTQGVPLLKAHHKSSIYEGMIREEKTYEKATQSQYATFRTISTGVRDESWWRKSIQARKYVEKVARYVEKILPAAFDAYLESQK